MQAIADDLNVTKEIAQEIYDKVMHSFPDLERFIHDSENMARELGYVTTIWGRKRRLPNMQLPEYEFTYIDSAPKQFDPMFDVEDDYEVEYSLQQKYIRLMNRAYGRAAKERVKEQAKKEGIRIKDNGGFIAEATRQTVNSRVQGSAAEQTKIAMRLIGTDKRLKELNFKLLLTVHDELIAECPKENVKEVAERFSNLMVEAGKDLLVPSVCDVTITDRWYGDEIENI